MRSIRTSETTVLGYHIERLDEYEQSGMLKSIRYEVLCPHTGAVLGSHSSLRAAHKHVILHELRSARQLHAGEREISRVA